MNKNERFVITINRELGSGGRTVGRILAEKLGVPYYDKALTKPLEEKFNMTSEQIERLKGNNRSWWENIANEESCVIAGRSAFFVTNGHQNRLNVLIQASMDHRVNRIMGKRGISEKEAKKIIKEVDETREEYLKNNAHTSRYDTRNYDLVIKMDGKTEEEAVNVILAFIG